MNAVIEKIKDAKYSWIDKDQLFDYLQEEYAEAFHYYEDEYADVPSPDLFHLVDMLTGLLIENIIRYHADSGEIDGIGYTQEECQQALNDDNLFDEMYVSMKDQHGYSKSYSSNEGRLNYSCEHDFISAIFELLMTHNMTFSMFIGNEHEPQFFNSPLQDVW